MMDHKVGVIPFEIHGDCVAILFVTSKSRKRWIFPKGNRKSGESHKKACKREAFEEAGVKGFLLLDIPMTNVITKSSDQGPIDVAVTYFPMFVEKQQEQWPESTRKDYGLLLRMRPRLLVAKIFCRLSASLPRSSR